MGRPFSERVTHDEWRRAAEGWIRDELASRDVAVVGPVEQPRVRPWSTQLTVPTDAGRFWFKANTTTLTFEPALQATLSRLAPDLVDEPWAVDAVRGWMLTPDRGATLGDSRTPTTDDWGRALRSAARVQQQVLTHEDALLATGLPDCRPATVVGRFDRLVEMFAELPDDHPAHVTEGLRAQLLDARPRLVDAVAELDESPLPTTWQHGDLHPRNIFAADGRFFDLGDGQWAHAAELLVVPHGMVEQQGGLAWHRVLEAYAGAWDLTAEELVPVWRAATVTQPVNRTLLWWGCLLEASAQEWATWGHGVLQHLTRVLGP